MIDIRPLTQFHAADLQRLMTGYNTDAKYQIRKIETAQQFVLIVELVALPQPYHKRYDPLDAETLAQYEQAPACGCSFAAYDGEACVGLALAEPYHWNQSLWVHELHVAETHRGRGIGRRLVEALTEQARTLGLRTIVCETQNTNVPSIHFYRSVGFTIEGMDLSYYTNDDFPNGEIALFMKKSVM